MSIDYAWEETHPHFPPPFKREGESRSDGGGFFPFPYPFPSPNSCLNLALPQGTTIMFIAYARIIVKAGDGGHGIIALPFGKLRVNSAQGRLLRLSSGQAWRLNSLRTLRSLR